MLKQCREIESRLGVVIEQKRKATGSMLSVKLICHKGHEEVWESQPVVKRKPLGNVLLAAAILFTGNTYAGISHLASCMKVFFTTHK